MFMKIITNGWPTDNEVLLSDTSITYVQNGDCTEGSDNVQSLTISTRDNGCANFLNIKTESWSIDNFKEMETILKDFCERINYQDFENDSFEEILYSLLELHKELPDLRFGQLLCNIGITMDREGNLKDIFSTPDKQIKVMIENYGPKSSS